MANYNVDIEIALKGSQKLKEFNRSLKEATREITKLNKTTLKQSKESDKAFKARDIANVNNYSKAVNRAAAAVRKAALNTEAEKTAITNLVRARKTHNVELERQNKLIRDQERAQGITNLANRRIGSSNGVSFQSNLSSPIMGGRHIKGSPLANQFGYKPKLGSQGPRAGSQGGNLQSAALGVGFPLLFGGGAGSIAGGLAGSSFGFGGQILGSALGQQLDKLAAFALKAGAALNDPINGFEELIALSREYGREVKGQQKLLIALGLSEVAAVQAAETFETAYGTKTVRDLKNLKDVTETFQDALTRLGVAMAALLSGPVGSALQALTVFLPASRLDKNQENIARLKGERRTLQEQAAEQLKFREEHNRAGSRTQAKIRREEQEKFSNRIARKTEEINKLEKERKQIIQEQNSFLNSQSKQVELIESQLKAIAEIDERRTKQEQMRLTARRDAFASYSAETEIKDAQRELDIVNENLKAQQKLDAKQTVIGAETDSTAFLNALTGGEKSAETKQLEQEQLAAQQKLNRARFKGANDVITVERALRKEQLASSASRIRLLNQRQELSLKFEQGEKGRFALYEQEQMQLLSGRILRG